MNAEYRMRNAEYRMLNREKRLNHECTRMDTNKRVGLHRFRRFFGNAVQARALDDFFVFNLRNLRMIFFSAGSGSGARSGLLSERPVLGGLAGFEQKVARARRVHVLSCRSLLSWCEKSVYSWLNLLRSWKRGGTANAHEWMRIKWFGWSYE